MPSIAETADVWLKTRSSSRDSASSLFNKSTNATLFPAGFGVSVGERFDDISAIPKGLSIHRIKTITVHHGAWIDSLNTTYMLSDGSELTCRNGPQGGRVTQYDLASNEVLLALGGLLGFIRNTDLLVGDLMIDYLQFHIKNVDTGEVRIVPEDPESYGSSQGADFFVQGPIIAFSGRLARYVSQIQPYLTRENDTDFGLPQPGLAFDDRKTSRSDPIQRIKSITVQSGAWIEGLHLRYQTSSGREIACSHGSGRGGLSATTALLDGEQIDAISVCNSGPFPFCDAMRFYLTMYDQEGGVVGRRTVPDKSSPAYGYEYDYAETLWIRAPKDYYIFAFSGVVGSYVEELACWTRNSRTGEELLIQPLKKTRSPTSLAITPPSDDLPSALPTRWEDHRRSFSSSDGVSSSLSVLQCLAVHNPRDLTLSSPQSALPSSIPSSPSLPTSLGRLSISGYSVGDGPAGDASPRIASVLDSKRKRLSGQYALKYADDVQRQQRRLSQNAL